MLATIGLIAILCLAAGASAHEGGITPTVKQLRHGLKVERATTNRLLERRCRPGRRWPAVPSVWDVRRDRVGQVLQRELRRQRYVRRSSSRCLPARMRRAYNAIPAWRQEAWADIHGCEGAWNDSGDPYWGGLQMDRSFMRSYGADALRWYGGLANVWPPFVQTVVADRAWRSRGFHPWPTCARRAGLI